MGNYYLNDEILNVLITAILNKTNQRIAQRIVQTVDPADATHIPSSAAVYKAIQNIGHASMKTVVGELPVDPDEDIIYLHKDSESDPTWDMNVWIDGAWVVIGNTSVDLSGYYSKDDVETLKTDLGLDGYWAKTDVDALKTAIGYQELTPITDDMITAAVDAAFAATEPSLDNV